MPIFWDVLGFHRFVGNRTFAELFRVIMFRISDISSIHTWHKDCSVAEHLGRAKLDFPDTVQSRRLFISTGWGSKSRMFCFKLFIYWWVAATHRKLICLMNGRDFNATALWYNSKLKIRVRIGFSFLCWRRGLVTSGYSGSTPP